MIPITAAKIEKLIKNAEAEGVPESELQELREELAEVKSGKLERADKTRLMYKEVIRDGQSIVRVSTAPPSLDDDDDFEGVTFKPIKRRSTGQSKE